MATRTLQYRVFHNIYAKDFRIAARAKKIFLDELPYMKEVLGICYDETPCIDKLNAIGTEMVYHRMVRTKLDKINVFFKCHNN